MLRYRALQRKRTGIGVATEQCALRAAENFDAFNVEEGADDRARPRQVYAVHKNSYARFCRGVTTSTHATDVKSKPAGCDAFHGAEVGCQVPELMNRRYICSSERVAGKGRDRNWNVLDILWPLLTGDHDLLCRWCVNDFSQVVR